MGSDVANSGEEALQKQQGLLEERLPYHLDGSHLGWNHLYSNLSSLAFCLNGTTAEKHYNNMDIPNYGRDYEMVNISLPFELTARPYPGSLPLNTTDLVGLIPFYNFKFGRKYT
eukprot:Seg1817.12 transcript_id=Seg1817.12/GoldUCD/mRNA.D3Y31 product="hypothetical protein" protein_id=Seg1817.12/GoldUCD/D3Y31